MPASSPQADGLNVGTQLTLVQKADHVPRPIFTSSCIMEGANILSHVETLCDKQNSRIRAESATTETSLKTSMGCAFGEWICEDNEHL